MISTRQMLSFAIISAHFTHKMTLLITYTHVYLKYEYLHVSLFQQAPHEF